MFYWNLLKPVMQKARVVEPKTQRSFVDSHESSVGGVFFTIKIVNILRYF